MSRRAARQQRRITRSREREQKRTQRQEKRDFKKEARESTGGNWWDRMFLTKGEVADYKEEKGREAQADAEETPLGGTEPGSGYSPPQVEVEDPSSGGVIGLRGRTRTRLPGTEPPAPEPAPPPAEPTPEPAPPVDEPYEPEPEVPWYQDYIDRAGNSQDLLRNPYNYMAVPGRDDIRVAQYAEGPYRGLPMAIITTDENGNDIVIQDLSGIAEQLAAAAEATDELANTTFSNWMAERGLGLNDPLDMAEHMGLYELIQQMEEGPTAEDIGDAESYAAGLMGMEPEEFSTQLERLLGTAMEGPGSVQGFSDAERDLRSRANRANLAEAERRATRMVQNIHASTGSTSRALMASDTYARQINDLQLRQDVQMAQEEYERQLDTFDSQMGMLDRMLQTRQIGVQDYLNRVEQGVANAFQSSLSMINISLAENTQYLQAYQQDFNALLASVQNMYNAANFQLGLQEDTFNTVNTLFEMTLAPALSDLQIQAAQLQLDATEQAMTTDRWSTIFEGIGSITDIITALTGAGD